MNRKLIDYSTRLVGLFLLAVAAAGCGGAVSSRDLGTVVYELPKIPGADQPYPLPELTAPPAEAGEPLGVEAPPKRSEDEPNPRTSGDSDERSAGSEESAPDSNEPIKPAD